MSSETSNSFTPGKPEAPEPKALRRPLPIFFIALVGVFLFWGQLYMDRYGGRFSSDIFTPYLSAKELDSYVEKSDDQKLYAKGAAIFKTYCEVCHQASGLGVVGEKPPLAGSEWVLAEGPNRIIRIVLSGFTGPVTVKGNSFNNTMGPFGPALSDDDVAAVLTFVRQNKDWGNKASAVKSEQVKAIRAAGGERPQAWTAAELENVPVK